LEKGEKKEKNKGEGKGERVPIVTATFLDFISLQHWNGVKQKRLQRGGKEEKKERRYALNFAPRVCSLSTG